MLRVFIEFDQNGDGSLDITEFRVALGIMGVSLSPDRMRKLFKYFDQATSPDLARPRPISPDLAPLRPTASLLDHHDLALISP